MQLKKEHLDNKCAKWILRKRINISNELMQMIFSLQKVIYCIVKKLQVRQTTYCDNIITDEFKYKCADLIENWSCNDNRLMETVSFDTSYPNNEIECILNLLFISLKEQLNICNLDWIRSLNTN
ncbi:hypothetical protein RFI_37928 [Reticulomyxa filosa]|uniref:Uncharacterized protein n=1 Tax=Reticulomyxa filosa TaxID=46433 RepID=X6LC01_RETFI|nr:hypothetical protein RFI_37928 [Reticulomyxa filosa]|eukprot:ETN99542.1 hypothetical protein RFI_37928 [Reticulomyxa filosa]